MLIICHLLLMLMVGRCTSDQIETKNASVGQHIKLTCPDKSFRNLVWIRLVPGGFPEVLGRTFKHVNVDPRITKEEDTTGFVLRIKNVAESDAGVYCCLTTQNDLTFLTRVDLRVEEPSITAVPPSVRPEVSTTLQCSVTFDSENKTCPGNHSVYWFRAAPNESQPILNSIQRNVVQENEERYEGLSEKKCVYSFSKAINSSDAGIYYCAVATCEEIFGRNTSKPEAHTQWTDTVLSLLCAAFAISLCLVVFIRRSCDCCSDTVTTGRQPKEQFRNLWRDEEPSVYSAVIFSIMKSSSSGRRDA